MDRAERIQPAMFKISNHLNCSVANELYLSSLLEAVLAPVAVGKPKLTRRRSKSSTPVLDDNYKVDSLVFSSKTNHLGYASDTFEREKGIKSDRSLLGVRILSVGVYSQTRYYGYEQVPSNGTEIKIWTHDYRHGLTPIANTFFFTIICFQENQDRFPRRLI